jgi:hypothetical protein
MPPQPFGGRFERLGQPGARPKDSGHTPQTVDADKGSHTKAFLQQCREMGVRPPVAQIEKRRVKGAGRTHHLNARVHNQSTHPQRNRGTLWLVQSSQRAAAHPVPRRGQRSRPGLIHRNRLQSCPHELSGSRPAGPCLRPPRPLDPESTALHRLGKQNQNHTQGAHQQTSPTLHPGLYSTAKGTSTPKRAHQQRGKPPKIPKIDCFGEKYPSNSANFNSQLMRKTMTVNDNGLLIPGSHRTMVEARTRSPASLLNGFPSRSRQSELELNDNERFIESVLKRAPLGSGRVFPPPR